MTTKKDKAFLKYHDAKGFGQQPAENLRIAKLAFNAGYDAAKVKKQKMVIQINHCARCGDHHELLFTEIENPIEDNSGLVWTHWAICPDTDDPLILKIQEKEGENDTT